jgi:retron-type reverse transcriptase
VETRNTRTGRSGRPTIVNDGDVIGGRGSHQALDALSVAITSKKVNWILDADVKGFFDAIDHQWLIKFLEHRIGDRRIL